MNFLIIPTLVFSLFADDSVPAKPLATVEELTTQVAEQKQENERLTKLLNAYVGKSYKCDQELTMLQTLGPAQTQAQQKIQRRVGPGNVTAPKGAKPDAGAKP